MQMTSNLCSHSHKLANTCKSKTGRHWGFQLIGHFIMWYFKNLIQKNTKDAIKFGVTLFKRKMN